jgi:acetamidase/formamidase
MAREHHLDPSLFHHDWDTAREPALVVGSGDVVHFDLLMAGDRQVTRSSTAGGVAWDWDTLYNLGGPVYVEGAAPGDTLRIDVVELTPGPWGWTAVMPEAGLLPADFPEPILRIFELLGGHVAVAPGVRVPVRPFLGTMGVVTGEPGRQDPFPPHRGGGNIDCRHLVAGSSLYLPVWAEGGLFSCGDPHAAQGDGEVCVSAVECAMRATLRLTVTRKPIRVPSYSVPCAAVAPGPYLGTMGIGPDLMEGARTAVRAMIDLLVAERGLTREDAYVLCSLAGDLRIHEIVDAGVWNVGLTMPLDVFVEPAA